MFQLFGLLLDYSANLCETKNKKYLKNTKNQKHIKKSIKCIKIIKLLFTIWKTGNNMFRTKKIQLGFVY